MPHLFSRFTRGGLFLAALFCISCGLGRAVEPLNLSEAKRVVSAYYDSGAYLKDVQTEAARANAWIEERVARRVPGEKLAIVLDIDETVLSNLPLIRRLDYGYVPLEWDVWVARAEAPVIEPMKQLCLRVRTLGVDLIFITARKTPSLRAATELNLQRQGLGFYRRLLMVPDSGASRSNADAKVLLRQQVEAEGFIIIANIGDQKSDLAGGHAERCFKLPCPIYETN